MSFTSYYLFSLALWALVIPLRTHSVYIRDAVRMFEKDLVISLRNHVIYSSLDMGDVMSGLVISLRNHVIYSLFAASP